MSLHISNTCAHHHVVKIALHSLWYHHTLGGCLVHRLREDFLQPVHQTATYMCDDTRDCVMQFWPPDDEQMCSKHVEAWNKLIVKQKLFASSWLITETKPYMFRTLPLSNITSFITVHTALIYIIRVCYSCQQICIYCRVYCEKLLTRDRGTVRNLQSFIPKINLRN